MSSGFNPAVDAATKGDWEGGKDPLNRTRYFYTEYSNIKFYEGQISLKEILKRLPSFRILKRFKNDVLLENIKIATSN